MYAHLSLSLCGILRDVGVFVLSDPTIKLRLPQSVSKLETVLNYSYPDEVSTLELYWRLTRHRLEITTIADSSRVNGIISQHA